jgi:3-hydroxybutyryl-CoA dehydrogenase
MVNDIRIVGVIGIGTLGKQIAKTAALFDYIVNIYDVKLEGLEDFVKRTNEAVKEEGAKGLISLHNSLSSAVKKADLIIESVPEKLELKKEIFTQIDKAAPSHAIIATNSSSIPVSKIESAVHRKEKVLNIHFYQLTRLKMADIMRGSKTTDETFQKGKDWLESIKISPLIVKKECLGFVFNRVWRAVKKESLKIWANGNADIQDVDKAWKIFTGMKVGPFKMMDAVGLDVVYDIEMSYFKESSDSNDKPPQKLKAMIERGELGRKSGKGFYAY